MFMTNDNDNATVEYSFLKNKNRHYPGTYEFITCTFKYIIPLYVHCVKPPPLKITKILLQIHSISHFLQGRSLGKPDKKITISTQSICLRHVRRLDATTV